MYSMSTSDSYADSYAESLFTSESDSKTSVYGCSTSTFNTKSNGVSLGLLSETPKLVVMNLKFLDRESSKRIASDYFFCDSDEPGYEKPTGAFMTAAMSCFKKKQRPNLVSMNLKFLKGTENINLKEQDSFSPKEGHSGGNEHSGDSEFSMMKQSQVSLQAQITSLAKNAFEETKPEKRKKCWSIIKVPKKKNKKNSRSKSRSVKNLWTKKWGNERKDTKSKCEQSNRTEKRYSNQKKRSESKMRLSKQKRQEQYETNVVAQQKRQGQYEPNVVGKQKRQGQYGPNVVAKQKRQGQYEPNVVATRIDEVKAIEKPNQVYSSEPLDSSTKDSTNTRPPKITKIDINLSKSDQIAVLADIIMGALGPNQKSDCQPAQCPPPTCVPSKSPRTKSRNPLKALKHKSRVLRDSFSFSGKSKTFCYPPPKEKQMKNKKSVTPSNSLQLFLDRFTYYYEQERQNRLGITLYFN